MNRDTAMEKAAEAINGGRQDDYGDAFDNFTHIARLWEAHLRMRMPEVEIKASDVGWMMGQVKQARSKGGYHEDTQVDAVGYSALTAEVAYMEDQGSNMTSLNEALNREANTLETGPYRWPPQDERDVKFMEMDLKARGKRDE